MVRGQVTKGLTDNIFYAGNSEELEQFVRDYAASFGLRADQTDTNHIFSEFRLYLGEDEGAFPREFVPNVSVHLNYGEYGILKSKVIKELDQRIIELNSICS